MPAPTHVSRSRSISAVCTALLALLGLCAAPIAAESLVKRGAEFQVNGATDQASHADVAFGAVGDMAVAFQNDLSEVWMVRAREGGDGTLTLGSEQLVANDGFTLPQVLPHPDVGTASLHGLDKRHAAGASGATIAPDLAKGYVAVQTVEDEARLVFPDLPSQLTLVDQILSLATVSDVDLEGFSLTYTTYGDVTNCRRYAWGGVDNREPLLTGYSATFYVRPYHEASRGVSLPTSSGSNVRLEGRTQRTPTPEPGLLLAELAHDEYGGSYILGRLFDGTAAQVGDPFPINPPTFDGFKVAMDLAASPSGVAMVVWEDLTYGRQPVFALVDSQGPIPGASGFVSSPGSVEQSAPRVVAIGEHFVVTWRRRGVNGNPDTIHARSIDATDSSAPVLGPEVEVSGTVDAGGRLDPTLAADESGNVAVVWTESSPDLLFSDVVGQRLRLENTIFVDGFESGNWQAWSGGSL